MPTFLSVIPPRFILSLPAMLSVSPFTPPSVIKCSVIWARCGSLPTTACCDLNSLLLRTCLSAAGSIGKDSAHKAEVTGRDCEKGERDLWRIQYKKKKKKKSF